MSIQAEIDAVVGAFVEDLANLVRRTAVSVVEQAFGAPAAVAPRPRVAAPSVARPAPAPAPRRKAAAPVKAPVRAEPEPEVVEEAPPPPAPTPLRKRLSDQRRGRLFVVPSTPQPVIPLEPEFESETKVEAPVAEAAPARNKWVIVRRPARERAPAAEGDAGGDGPAADAQAAAAAVEASPNAPAADAPPADGALS